MDFVDTHVHYFDWREADRGLTWSWLAPEAMHPILGDINGMKSQRFTAEEFRAESRFSNVSKCVHVQAALGTEDPVVETAWLQEMADDHGFPDAIVADASLQDPDVDRVLERHSEFRNMRGIRDFGQGDYLVDPAFHRGYAHLEKYGWVCDLDCFWENFHKARALAEQFPNIVLVLDHAGFPQERTDEYFANWSRALHDLAGADNVVVKISGLGMRDERWTVDSLRPWVHECLEAFGTDRAFFGTNWPLDRLYSSYTDVISAYRELVTEFTDDEQRALLAGNAERVYRI